MINTVYGITLKYLVADVQVESFTYHPETNMVSGVAYNDVHQVTLAQAQDYLEATSGFIDLVNAKCKPAPTEKEDFRLRIRELPAEPNKRMRFRWDQGDLSVDVTYDWVADDMNGTQTAFTLSWCDFMAYYRAWKHFIEEIASRG